MAGLGLRRLAVGCLALQGAPVVVRGLGRHMELQDLARRQREEQEKREAETFITNPQVARPARCARMPGQRLFSLTYQLRTATAMNLKYFTLGAGSLRLLCLLCMSNHLPGPAAMWSRIKYVS